MTSKINERKFTKIYFRVFPMEKMSWDYVKILDDNKTIYIRCLQELVKAKENAIPTFWTFHTDRIFYNVSQKQIYDCVIADVINNISRGRDAIIMAYGQTGTGKTLTISGLQQYYDDRGILPRVIPDLFQMIQSLSTRNVRMALQVSFVEISKSTIVDLLKPHPNSTNTVKDITKSKVKSENEVLKLIFQGEGRREYAENSPYPSNCSSSIFTFYITTKKLDMGENGLSRCKLHIIDLAGNDTVGNFSCLFKNPADIGFANLSKTQLEQFFLVLSKDIPEHIKINYRQNPMLQYLGNSLSNSSVLRLIGHIRVSREDLLVTISMLRFGELVRGLKASKYEINVDNNQEVTQQKMEQLQNEIGKLKLENKYNFILKNQDLCKVLNEGRIDHVKRTVEEYLQNKITEVTLLNVCEFNIALEILKSMCNKSEASKNKDNSSVTKLKDFVSHSPKGKLVHSSSSRVESLKKVSDSGKLRGSSSGSTKASKNKISSLTQATKPTKQSKTSSLNVTKRPSTSSRRRCQSSNASTHEGREGRSRSTSLLPEVPTTYKDAWNLYLSERSDEYATSATLYEKNENLAKAAYAAYVTDVNRLKQVMSEVENRKSDTIAARMTREFQHLDEFDEKDHLIVSELEQHCLDLLKKSENEQLEMQERVLKDQAELKAYVDVCKKTKAELKSNFDEFCQEKFKVPVMNVSEDKNMNIEEIFENVEEKVTMTVDLVPEKFEANVFKRFQSLIDKEKKKKELYKKKQREWLLH